MKTALEKRLSNLGGLDGMVAVTADKVNLAIPNTDIQPLRVVYRSLLDPMPYIDYRVKI